MASYYRMKDYEYEIAARLVATYELNHQGGGMEDDHDLAFGRNPSPVILPGSSSSAAGNTPERINDLLRLPWLFEATLFKLEEAKLYDGSAQSAVRFEEATGISPARFAQAWLETRGTIWQCYHPHHPNTGEDVAKAMCVFWAAKTKHWRTEPASEVKANVSLKCSAKSFEEVEKAIEHLLPCSVNGRDREEFAVLRQIKIIANPDCPAHPMRSLCDCETALRLPVRYERNLKGYCIRSITTQLVNNDDAFFYTGETASSTLFKVRMNGQTPTDFVRRMIGVMGAHNSPLWRILSEPQLIQAILAFWAAKVRHWRNISKTRREVRTKHHEEFMSDSSQVFVPWDTMIPQPVDQHTNDNKDDPLCRYVRLEGEKAGHMHTAVLYAKSTANEFGYNVLRITPCHEACGLGSVVRVDIAPLVKDFVDEDMARAKAVRAEW